MTRPDLTQRQLDALWFARGERCLDALAYRDPGRILELVREAIETLEHALRLPTDSLGGNVTPAVQARANAAWVELCVLRSSLEGEMRLLAEAKELTR